MDVSRVESSIKAVNDLLALAVARSVHVIHQQIIAQAEMQEAVANVEQATEVAANVDQAAEVSASVDPDVGQLIDVIV